MTSFHRRIKMLEVQGKIEWVSTLEVDTNKPGIVPGVITPTFYGSLEEIVEALPSMIDSTTLNPFRKISSVWIRTGGTEGYSVFEYIARVDENFIILEVVDLQSIYVDSDSNEELALVWTKDV